MGKRRTLSGLRLTEVVIATGLNEETIRRLGFETKTAQGGEQALQILEGPDRASIALVLLDHVMPGVDGMEVLRRLSSKQGTPPIIMQTISMRSGMSTSDGYDRSPRISVSFGLTGITR